MCIILAHLGLCSARLASPKSPRGDVGMSCVRCCAGVLRFLMAMRTRSKWRCKAAWPVLWRFVCLPRALGCGCHPGLEYALVQIIGVRSGPRTSETPGVEARILAQSVVAVVHPRPCIARIAVDRAHWYIVRVLAPLHRCPRGHKKWARMERIAIPFAPHRGTSQGRSRLVLSLVQAQEWPRRTQGPPHWGSRAHGLAQRSKPRRC